MTLIYPMTFIYELDPYPQEIYLMSEYELPTSTDRDTDMTEII